MDFHLRSLDQAINFCNNKKAENEALAASENISLPCKSDAKSYDQLTRWLQELKALREAFEQQEMSWAKVRARDWNK
jgi:hypothetical protein